MLQFTQFFEGAYSVKHLLHLTQDTYCLGITSIKQPGPFIP